MKSIDAVHLDSLRSSVALVAQDTLPRELALSSWCWCAGESRRLVTLVFIGWTALMATLLCSGCHQSELFVRIENHGSAPVSRIGVSYEGGSFVVSNLDPGESSIRRIDPSGESMLQLDYEGQSHTINEYFEPGYRGTITVEIRGRDAPISHSDVEPRSPWMAWFE